MLAPTLSCCIWRASETHVNSPRSRVGSGYSPKLELQQAQAEYDATAQIVPQIELAIARTEDARSWLEAGVKEARKKGDGHALGELESALATL